MPVEDRSRPVGGQGAGQVGGARKSKTIKYPVRPAPPTPLKDRHAPPADTQDPLIVIETPGHSWGLCQAKAPAWGEVKVQQLVLRRVVPGSKSY